MPERDRHTVTIVFSDLSHSVAMADQLEAEDYSNLLRDLRDMAQGVIEHHGGEVIRALGDGFVFIFGYPEPDEDATRTAIDAIMELHTAVESLDTTALGLSSRLQFHTGIHSGVVILREGDPVVGSFDLSGTPVNMAERLCGLARPGEIIISETSIGSNRHLFDFSAPEEVTPRGMDKSLGIRRILKTDPEPGAAQSASQSPLLGRTREREWLSHFVRQPREGPGLALIEADPGMGKSRLLWEFLNAPEPGQTNWHLIACVHSSRAGEQRPLAQLSRSLAGEEDTAPPEAAIDELIARLVEAATDKPVLLAIDDWQWADDELKRFVEGLLRTGPPGLSLIVATRAIDKVFATQHSAGILRLDALKDRHADALARSIAPRLDPFALKRIKRLAGGNALYIEELSHAWNRVGTVLGDEGDEAWLYGVITARLATWSENVQACVRAAAIIGDTVPVWLLEALRGETLTPPLLNLLSRADFLHPGQQAGTLRFRHGITRKAVASILGQDERRALHRKAGEAIEARAQSEPLPGLHGQLALHAAGCGDHDTAIEHANRAGAEALASTSLDQAQGFYALAMDEIMKARGGGEQLEKAVKNYGRASILDPSREQLARLTRVDLYARERGDKRVAARCQYWQGFIHYGLGDPSRSLEMLVASRELATELDDAALLSRIAGTIGQVFVTAADYEAAHPALDKAIAMQRARYKGARVPMALAYNLACKAFALADQGNTSGTEALFAEALELVEGHDHEVRMAILAYAACADIWRGDMDQTIKRTEQVMALSARMHSRFFHAISSVLNRAAMFQISKAPDALQEIEQATQWMMSVSQQRISLCFGFLAEGYALLGEHQQARTYAARALNRARSGDRLGEVAAYRALALLALGGGLRFGPGRYVAKAYGAANRRASERERLMTQLMVHRCLDASQDEPTAQLDALGITANYAFVPPAAGSQSETSTISEAGRA